MNNSILVLALASLTVPLTACSKLTVSEDRECAEASIAVANALKETMNSPIDADPLGIRQTPTSALRTEWGLAHAAAKRWQQKACK